MASVALTSGAVSMILESDADMMSWQSFLVSTMYMKLTTFPLTRVTVTFD